MWQYALGVECGNVGKVDLAHELVVVFFAIFIGIGRVVCSIGQVGIAPESRTACRQFVGRF